MKYTKDIVLTALGWGFISVGVMSIFLPFLQGILFIIIGLYLLSIGSPKAREKIRVGYAAFKVRFPHIALALEKLEKKWENLIERWRQRFHSND